LLPKPLGLFKIHEMTKIIFFTTLITLSVFVPEASSGNNLLAVNKLSLQFSGALTEFVADVTNNNKAAIRYVQRITKDIPRSDEEVGFYLADDASEEEAVFRATISYLVKNNFVMAFEDKYVSEMLEVFYQNKVLATGKDRKEFRPFMSEKLYEDAEIILEENGDNKKWREYSLNLRDKFPPYAQAIESLFTEHNKALMSVDIPLGDTLFFIVMDKKNADKWRNTVFLGDTHTLDYFGVRDANWENYWSFFTYSAKLHDDASKAHPDIIKKLSWRKVSKVKLQNN
jgi:hypothetical protein